MRSKTGMTPDTIKPFGDAQVFYRTPSSAYRAAMFETLLIAGEGPGALRVERTCKRLGIDLAAPGDVPARPEDVQSVVEAAKRTGAQAIHPGGLPPRVSYALARAAHDAEIRYVGPPPDVLSLFADKTLLRDAAMGVGMAVLPAGGPCETIEQVRSAAADLDFPVILKPVGGAGGRGVHVARDHDELTRAGNAALEVAATVGGPVYLERWVEGCRQLEIVVIADAHGQLACLPERESTIRRESGALLTETPAPLFLFSSDGEQEREELAEAAMELASAIGLQGICTMEFLCDRDRQLVFLEANAGGASLASELLTGLDTLELELMIAAGGRLELDARFRAAGHAFEASLRGSSSETMAVLETLTLPPLPQGKARFVELVEVGASISADDPHIGSIATTAPVRHQALLYLDRILAETVVRPGPSNTSSLRSVLGHEGFRAGQYDRDLFDRYCDDKHSMKQPGK